MKRIAIIGAGAAGCFCAAELKRRDPDLSVTVFEAGHKPLAKVAVTGGGRCNLTNSFAGIGNLAEAYPRGTQLMKRALRKFSQDDCCRWFEDNGVRLVLQADQCVFPASQDAMEIVRTLTRMMRQNGVTLHTDTRVTGIRHDDAGYAIDYSRNGANGTDAFDAVVITTGGSPKLSGISFLDGLGLEIIAPVPSLFTFRISDEGIRKLMGIVVDDATLSIPGTKIKSEGTLLITDWGFSGPAALKLSSYAARHLAERSYTSEVIVNWLGTANDQDARNLIDTLIRDNSRKLLSGVHPMMIPSRLWEFLILRAGLRADIRCGELGSKGTNKLVSTLTCDTYRICGRAAFKEEFVTCGGVSTSNIDLNTLESRKHKGLYFAGEVLDIDAITGGFNLQAAWSTAYICAESISNI